jgi:hypothetical protein
MRGQTNSGLIETRSEMRRSIERHRVHQNIMDVNYDITLDVLDENEIAPVGSDEKGT